MDMESQISQAGKLEDLEPPGDLLLKHAMRIILSCCCLQLFQVPFSITVEDRLCRRCIIKELERVVYSSPLGQILYQSDRLIHNMGNLVVVRLLCPAKIER